MKTINERTNTRFISTTAVWPILVLTTRPRSRANYSSMRMRLAVQCLHRKDVTLQCVRNRLGCGLTTPGVLDILVDVKRLVVIFADELIEEGRCRNITAALDR